MPRIIYALLFLSVALSFLTFVSAYKQEQARIEAAHGQTR